MESPKVSTKGPLVSIITPTYNHEKFIGKCIESVLAQTYPNWELLIVDDGSTDATSNIVARYKDKRIKYIRQNHLGIWKLPETYNNALRRSKGELVAILEGDDFWPPYKLEEQVRAFDDKDVVLSWGRAAFVDETGKKIFGYSPPEKDLSADIYQNKPIGKILEKAIYEVPIPEQSVVCRKDALIKIGGFEGYPRTPGAGVGRIILELSLVGTFSATNKIVGYYRQHRAQVSIMTDDVKTQMATTEFLEGVFNHLPEEIKNKFDIDVKRFWIIRREMLARVHLAEGRKNLFRQKWSEARKNFMEAMNKGTPLTKLKALFGLGLSLAKRDFESIAKVLQKRRI